MATVTYVRERSGWTGEDREDGRTYERSWFVYRKTDGVMVALDFDDVYGIIVPAYAFQGATVAEFAGVECKSIQPRHHDDGSEVWTVTATYESPSAGQEEPPDNFNDFMSQSQSDNPSNPFRPKRSGGGQVIDEAFVQDLDQNDAVNSAGDPFDEPLVVPITIQVDSVTVNEREKPDTSKIGWCQGRKLLANVTYHEEEHVNRTTGATTGYFVNTYEVWTHPFRDWARVQVLDRGYRDKTFQITAQHPNGAFVLEPIRDQYGEPINKPALLDGGGAVLAPNGKPIILTFRVREEGDLDVPFM